MYYQEEQNLRSRLGYSEFNEIFYELLDTYITTSLVHVEANKEFYDDVIFKMFDVYQRDNKEYSVKELVLFFHIFLHSMFKNKPSTDRNEDEITLI